MTERALSARFARLSFLLVLGVNSNAWADDVEQAKAHFSIAARAYEANQFVVAIEGFQEAYRLAPRPALLFSIAQAHRRKYYADQAQEDLLKGIELYRRYIKDDPKGRRVDEALQALGELESLAARLNVSAAPSPDAATPLEQPVPEKSSVARLLIAPSVKGAIARVDGGPAVQLPNRIEVTPGRHSVQIEAADHLAEQREVDVGAGESFALDVRLTQKPALLQPRVEDGVRVYVDGRFTATTPLAKPLELIAGSHTLALTQNGHDPLSFEVLLKPGESKPLDAEFSQSTQRVGAYVLFGLSGALFVTGGVFTGLALHQESEAKDLQRRLAQTNLSLEERNQHEDAIDRRDTYRNIAIGTFAGGAAVGITAALLYLFDQPEPAAPAAPRSPTPQPEEKSDLDLAVAPLLSPTTAGLAVAGSL
ncbi:MAG TPA: PEGA domain-containing protein [Polyangiaceae bacterium]|nr:PEGA domain-containing protein [Polyangiaceae bacterium]